MWFTGVRANLLAVVYNTATEESALMTEPSYEELKAKLAELESKQQRTGTMSFKVSDKGGVSVYGLGRFPVTLYYEQWVRLLEKSQDLREFLEENKSKLKLKAQKSVKKLHIYLVLKQLILLKDYLNLVLRFDCMK